MLKNVKKCKKTCTEKFLIKRQRKKLEIERVTDEHTVKK